MNRGEPIILAIESSCDDTSAAVMVGREVKSNVVASQQVHEKFGGVVPELASRAHQKNIVPTVDEALRQSGIKKTDLDAVAFTVGPGLMGSLLVGSSFAKSMSMALDIPLIAVNHMEGHIMAHFIGNNNPSLPMLCLTVSGGHTQIVRVGAPMQFELIGETIDDAAGEAFDKCAKLMGLSYPGGPLVDKWAKKGDPHHFEFPISQTPDFKYSFSGLKTSVLYFLQKSLAQNPDFISENLPDLCASIQHTIVETLMRKFLKAAKKNKINTVSLAGGVSANSALRSRFLNLEDDGYEVHIPKFEYCTDNAAMIGIVAHYKYLDGVFATQDVVPSARLKF